MEADRLFERNRCRTRLLILAVPERNRSTMWRLIINGVVHGEYETWHTAEVERRKLAAA